MQWDYDFAMFNTGEKLIHMKRMGRDGWELVGFEGDKFWFKRPLTGSNYRAEEEEAADPKPRIPTLADPLPPPAETMSLTMKQVDEERILGIMSDAGFYVKDIRTDRSVAGEIISYTLTKREKK